MSFDLIARLARSIGAPLCVIDTETTGLLRDPVVGIVEIAYLKVSAEGEVSKHSQLVNPEIPIPWQATKVHGIKNKDVDSEAAYPAIQALIKPLFSNCVICGFNSREYDVPVIHGNSERYGLERLVPIYQLDVRDLWIAYTKSNTGKLAAVAEKYKVVQGEAHRAAGDVVTTANILEAMLWKHGADFVLRHLLRKEKEKPSPEVIQQLMNKVTSGGSVVPAVEKPKQPPKGTESPSKSSLIRKMVLDHIEASGRISPVDYESIAIATQGTAASVSFAVSELFVSGHIRKHHIADSATQEAIKQHLTKAIEMAGGSDRLKPIKEALLAIAGLDVDYVQLRVALADHFGTTLVGDEE